MLHTPIWNVLTYIQIYDKYIWIDHLESQCDSIRCPIFFFFFFFTAEHILLISLSCILLFVNFRIF